MSPYYFVQQLQSIWRRLTTLESRRSNPPSGSGSIDARTINAHSSYTWTFTDANAKVGDRIVLGTSTELVGIGYAFFGYQACCTTDGSISVTATNNTTGSALTAAGTITYSILK